MILTQKIRIFPNKEQEEILRTLSEKCRLIYNFALQERIANWKENKEKAKEDREYINYNIQQNQLPEIKKKYPEYKWVYSKVLQMTLKTLDANYKSFFALWKNGDAKARPPKFKGKKHFVTLSYNQSGFSIKDNTISFSHKHPSKTPLKFDITHYPLPKEIQSIKQVELFQDRKQWFIAISYEIEFPEYVDSGKYQAIDLGVSNIVSAVNSHGKFLQIKNNRADLYWKKKLEEVQSKRDHCKKYSRRWKRYNLKYVNMKRKCANQLKDFQHKISKKIVENTKANTIIVGNLKVKEMAKKTKKGSKISPKEKKAKKTLHHSIQNTGSMGRFAQFLTYKAEKIGKRIIKIDESYTTQVCAKCGKKQKRKIYERKINCGCGNTIDRDLNSAINIMVKFLSQESVVDTESFLYKWKGFTTIHSTTHIRSSSRLVGSPVL
jgi:putative transposase